MRCPSCKAENPADSVFCGKCATPLPRTGEPAISFTKTLETSAVEPTRGTVFAGRYEIIEELGAGGMGRVFRAHDTQLNEEVALKLIKPEFAAEKRVVERFRNEIKVARKITHKNVCRMHDLHEEGKTLFLTMEYVQGEDLKSLIHRTKVLSIGTALSYARQIAEGLAEAHKLGITHRDLKPSNVMIDKDGNAKIMDFGIARSLLGGGVTVEGAVIGTPEYMSPEQVEGNPADARSDIYSLGVILFEMVVGCPPFGGDTPFSVANKHKTEQPPIPKKLIPQIPEELNKLILRCLEKDRAKRFQITEDLVADLATIEQALPATDRIIPRARIKVSPGTTVKFRPRKLIIPAAVLIVIAAAILALVKILPVKKTASPSQPSISSIPAVAILYFRNNTGDRSLDIWREGLCQSLIIKLSQSRAMRVLDQSQIYGILQRLNFLDKTNFAPNELKEIASLGLATHIVQGNLSKAGDKFRIDLALQNASTGEMISAESADGTGEDSIFAMLDDLANRLKSHLGLSTQQIAAEIEREGSTISTSSTEAFKYYIQAFEFSQVKQLQEPAIPLLEKAIAADPQFATAYELLAIAEWLTGRIKESRVHHQKAFDLRQHASETERYEIEANYYLYKSERTWEKGIEALNKLVALYPWHGTGNGQLGWVHWAMDEWDKAVERFEVLRRYNVLDSMTYTNLAVNYLGMGMIEKARDVLEGYLNKFGDDSFTRAVLGTVYYILEDSERAKTEIDRAYAQSPELDKRYKFYFLMWTRDYVAAEAFLQELGPQTGLMGLRSISLLLQGRLKDAKAALNRDIEASNAVGESDLTTTGWLFSANLLEKTSDFAGASSACDSALRGGKELEKICEQCQALYRRGVVEVRQDDLVKAELTAQELKRTVESGPAKKRMYFYNALRGLLALKRKELSQAQDDLQKAVASTGIEYAYWWCCPRPEFLDYLAEAYAQAGRWPEAQKAYEEIQSLKYPRVWEPVNALIYVRSYYKLGQIFEHKGDRSRARENYRRFLDLWKNADPGLPEVEDTRKRLAAL